MKIPRVLVIALLVLSSFAASGAVPTKSELETMYDKAFREFDANHYDAALKALDAIDARQPDLAESQNLRGVVLMRKGDYGKAEAALRKALKIEPKFWNASFNLAEIPFLKKDWPEARNRFEALMSGDSDRMKGETGRLIQYKILLTFVRQGRENMVDWIVNKFEGEKDSPALYYSNAAIALQHNNEKEAKEWIDAAEKRYPASLNKLFAESFYEVGWLTKPDGETRAAIEITSTSERAAHLKADARANFERAERSFQQRDFPAALKFLDLADEGAPSQAASLNLRGEIFMEDKKLDEAEKAFHQAFAADPKFREAQYNLAQIPLKQKDYGKARERLEALFAQTPGGEKNQAAQLIKYKIFLTLLLEGNDAQAQKMMDQFKFTGDTPALYYAQAAWAFKHDNPDQGNDWIESARKIYSPALNIIFADTFYDLAWLQRAPDTAPPTTALAQADAAQTGPTPTMRFDGAESLPTPGVAGVEQTDAAHLTSSGSTAPVSAPAASRPVAAKPVSSPIAALAAKATPASARAKKPGESAPKVPVVVAGNSVLKRAAPALTPAQGRESSQPAFTEIMDHAAVPRALFFGGLLLAGVAILGWLVVQQLRRHFFSAPLYETSMPLTEPPFGGGDPISGDERRLSREQLAGGPPKLSLQLKASEPVVRQAAPSANLGTSKTTPESAAAPPNAPLISIPKVKPATVSAGPPAADPFKGREPVIAPNESKTPPAAPKAPLRHEKEVSRAAIPKSPVLPVGMPARMVSAPAPAIIAQPKTPVSEPKKLAAAAEAKPSVLPMTEPLVRREESVAPREHEPRLTSVAPPPPQRPAGEPQKLPTAAEVKPRVTPIAEPPARREEPIGQGEPVPQLTPVAATRPEVPVAEPQKLAATADAKPAVAPIVNPPVPSEEPVGQERLVPEFISVAPTPVQAPATEPQKLAPAGEAKPPVPTVAEPPKMAEPPTRHDVPIGRERLVPELTSTAPPPLQAPELTAPKSAPATEPDWVPVRIESETAAIKAIAGAHSALQSSVETPSFASKIITTKPTTPSATFVIMPESSITPISTDARTPSPAMAVQQPAGGMHTAVQLTFSLEIASMQLTPTFKMSGLQLKPTSKVVSMRLAPSQQPQPPMNLQVTFEVANIQLSGGTIGTIRLAPSVQEKPAVLTSPSFAISGLELMTTAGSAPVQVTPSHQEQASVHLTAEFQIAAIEFSPLFEITAIVLNSTSKNVSMQLPGSGPSSIDGAPIFEIENVQLGGNSELATIQVNPVGASGRRS